MSNLNKFSEHQKNEYSSYHNYSISDSFGVSAVKSKNGAVFNLNHSCFVY